MIDKNLQEKGNWKLIESDPMLEISKTRPLIGNHDKNLVTIKDQRQQVRKKTVDIDKEV